MKKVKLILLSLLFLIKNPISAQSVAELTQQITEGKATDSAKIEAIYDWLTHNVSYDDAHRRQREGDTVLRQEPYNVIVLKKAVCMGFAKTLCEMCRLSGIKAYLIEGWVKNSSGQVEREGHAWNAVKLNDNWYLLDATWDAGNKVINLKKYFLKDPSVFIENHLPHDPMWQLLNPPIALNCFINNRNCANSSPIPVFNFSDTIRLWQTLDTLQSLYNQSIRILNFNPNDLTTLRELADYYNRKAQITYAEYKQIRQEVNNKKRPANRKNNVLKLLETTVNCLKSAQLNYQELVKNNKKGEYTDAHWNYDSIQEMLINLESEKEFVERYFKN
jgi:transglutaminase/protease-like cytokinesis protein 3